MGYRLPEDVSFVGFGASDAEFAPGRKVTSVWVDCEGMGKTAAESLLSEMKERRGPPQRCRLPTRMIVRDSVAPVGAAVAGSVAGASLPDR
jgi:DNA-binding LacI/PurR family transcriptional regulator